MPHTGNPPVDIILYAIAGVIILIIGYRIGRWISNIANAKLIARKEQELFTAQKGFKNLYDQALHGVREENAKLLDEVRLLRQKVEDYRKKAAGFGGLFSSGGKRADAMYALLLENESLEEALYAQNEKLKQERTDALREQMRSTGYRRVLISQLLNDNRIKEYVSEILADDRRLPRPEHTVEQAPALPHHDAEPK
jgi:cell division protein FtsB